MMSFSPLEQFEIIPLYTMRLGFFDISITNSVLFGFIIMFLMISVLKLVLDFKNLITWSWHFVLLQIFGASVALVYENIGVKAKKYVPLIFVLFFFMITANVIGMVPYSFTVTSHLIVTFGFALIFFVGINIICIREHKLNFFSLFLPGGSSLALSFLLVPIEMVSYSFRLVSLPVRLFANMMAGHTLLKVIAGFAWTMMSAGGALFLAHYIPILLLTILMGLELGVALIQAYVFSILTCMYLNDAINLH